MWRISYIYKTLLVNRQRRTSEQDLLSLNEHSQNLAWFWNWGNVIFKVTIGLYSRNAKSLFYASKYNTKTLVSVGWWHEYDWCFSHRMLNASCDPTKHKIRRRYCKTNCNSVVLKIRHWHFIIIWLHMQNGRGQDVKDRIKSTIWKVKPWMHHIDQAEKIVSDMKQGKKSWKGAV